MSNGSEIDKRSIASLCDSTSCATSSDAPRSHPGVADESDEADSACGGGQSEETKRLEMMAALKTSREALVAKLEEKNRLLKELCIKEGELTGKLPPEMPLAPGEPIPTIRRRVGTEFALPENLLTKSSAKTEDDERVDSLELEFEIHTKITSAALKIANDAHASKLVRKQRKVSYQQCQRKLKDIETKLNTLKHSRQVARITEGRKSPAELDPKLNLQQVQQEDNVPHGKKLCLNRIFGGLSVGGGRHTTDRIG